MPGYLDQYGSGEERRETLIKRIVTIGLLTLIIVFLGYYLFKNHSQERVVKNFLELLRKQDYAGAYALWGCTQAKPCEGYAYDKFMEDWGPKGPNGASSLRISDSESCNTGVILTVQGAPGRQENLWVDRNNPAIGFSPVPVCPNKSSLAIMMHRTVGKLRKPFLN